MIYGRKWEDLPENKGPHTYFAWWPVLLSDGRTAWLENVRRFWRRDESANWAGDNSHWVYEALR